MRKLTLSVAAVTFAGVFASAQAAVYPKTAGFDNRVQEVVYNPSDVTVVRTRAGTVTTIKFEDGEFIKGSEAGLGIGDPLAWNIKVRGNNVFLRPVAEQPDTNILIVTNKRTYPVQLTTSKNTPAFLVRFVYPKPPEQTVFKPEVKYPCTEGNRVNLTYEVKGSQKIRPDGIWDNGRHTCMKWNNAVDLPVVFRILPDGNEQLVNIHMDKNVMVIHDVNPGYVLRLGGEVLQVRTAKPLPRSYNDKGTVNNKVRSEKKNDG